MTRPPSLDLACWSRFVIDQLAPLMTAIPLPSAHRRSFYIFFAVCGPEFRGTEGHDHFYVSSAAGGANGPLLLDPVLEARL